MRVRHGHLHEWRRKHRRRSPPFRSFGRDENDLLVFGLGGFVVVAIAYREVRQGIAITGIVRVRDVTVEFDQAQRLEL